MVWWRPDGRKKRTTGNGPQPTAQNIFTTPLVPDGTPRSDKDDDGTMTMAPTRNAIRSRTLRHSLSKVVACSADRYCATATSVATQMTSGPGNLSSSSRFLASANMVWVVNHTAVDGASSTLRECSSSRSLAVWAPTRRRDSSAGKTGSPPCRQLEASCTALLPKTLPYEGEEKS